MPSDILLILPDIAAIGQGKMQGYCNEWLQRPISRQYGIVQVNVATDLTIQVLLDEHSAKLIGGRAFVPVDELLGYIIDQHFGQAEKRHQLHAKLRDAKNRVGSDHRGQDVVVGKLGTYYLQCKNPACNALMETPHKGTAGILVTCPPTQLTCPVCGYTDLYDGSNLMLRYGG
jgi:hypothetical protein